jgi:hypothetical protein
MKIDLSKKVGKSGATRKQWIIGTIVFIIMRIGFSIASYYDKYVEQRTSFTCFFMV